MGMLAAGTPAMAREAPAASSSKGNITGLSVWGILTGWGLGAGARFAFPLGSSGLFRNNPKLSDEFAIEAGADLVFWGAYGVSAMTITPTVGVMWVFWLGNGKFGVYPKLDLGYEIFTSSFGGFGNGLWWDTAVGGIYRLGNLSLRAELGGAGYGAMLKVGVALNF